MKKEYTTVLFDLDGTLLDTSQGILNCIVYTEQNMPLPPLSRAQQKTFIGPPLLQSFINNYRLEEKDAIRAVEIYRERYHQKGVLEACTYEGIPELLDALKHSGKHLAVATLKLEEYAGKVLEHVDLNDCFECIAGADRMGRRTKADVIGECLKQTGCKEPGAAVLVGDSRYDMEGALAAGVDFIGVTYGFGFTAADGARFKVQGIPFVDDCAQLCALLLGDEKL